MHNNIMAAGSRDRPPMLATRRYAQWQSRFLRYIDTRPNGDALRKCILQGPYIPSTVIILVEPATNDSPEVLEQIAIDTLLNMSPENKAHYRSKKEAIHLLLTGIGDEIYSTIDACKIAHDIFTSHDGETMESYYFRFYKMMNEMYQKEVNEIRAERIAKNANPLALKNLALIAKYFKKLYKPTNNNLRTSLNSRNKNVDTSPQYVKDNQTGQFGNQRTVTIVGARETVGSQVVQHTGIQCFNSEKGVPLQADQADWLEDTDEEIDKQELEADYSFMAKIQEVLPADVMRYFAFGRHLGELHATWAHLKKKRTRLQTYTNITQDNVLSS
ncbi:hypothetical protein Tco_1341877 [Tanacetum coccineum]